ncbi:hypothetical protein [Acidovorax sp. LjRoot66]|uniref:hypothetical protein n=1 Tax=Acidovorax sp. LjRoot66 TaxID=3342334 RepID=UPI003F507B88
MANASYASLVVPACATWLVKREDEGVESANARFNELTTALAPKTSWGMDVYRKKLDKE